MTWLLPDPPPIVVVHDWEITFQQWLAKLDALLPGGLSLDLIGADETFGAFQDGVSATDHAVTLQARRPAGQRRRVRA